MESYSEFSKIADRGQAERDTQLNIAPVGQCSDGLHMHGDEPVTTPLAQV